jgi:uncharacterized membrane protein
MSELSLALFTVTRFLHVATAIVLVGGSIFIRYVLMPAATASLSDDVHAQLRAQVMNRWKRFVHLGIGLLLTTGLINFGRKIALLHAAGIKDPVYHGVMGLKILLALVIFFIASALVGKSARMEPIRKNARYWITVNIILGLIVVAISGFLRVKG